MGHDQLFKELLREFFPAFVRLFFPDVAARTDFSHVTYPDREVFTDFPEGEERRTDFVAEARTLDGEPAIFLFHIETQTDPKADFPWRMLEYYMLLRLRFRRPVFPVALFPTRGAHGQHSQTYVEGLFGQNTLSFAYGVVALPDFNAES